MRRAMGLLLLLCFGFVMTGCLDAEIPGDTLNEHEAALAAAAATAPPTAVRADDTTDEADDDGRASCRFASATELTASDTATLAQPELIAARPRIVTKLRVEDLGSRLRLHVSFHNPYRCHWRGDLFLEQEDAGGAVHMLARRHNLTLRGGATLSGNLDILRPAGHGEHLFLARAYHVDGKDSEVYVACLADSTAASLSEACLPELDAIEEEEELLLAEQVLSDKLRAEPVVEVSGARLQPCPIREDVRPPMFVDLRLWLGGAPIELQTAWQNVTRRPWKGDLYMGRIDPYGELELIRRDLGVTFAPGIGFCTLDVVRRPTDPGRHVFHARALRRDGSAEATWANAGTTEIIAVCNRELCELIQPDQWRARITLTGPSVIHLQSDFFSEWTRVTMEYGHREFDITDRCRIRQYLAGDQNHVEVHFDSFNLPIGPRTWAHYTIRLNPMPVIPPGAKTSDSLWILTNGPE